MNRELEKFLLMVGGPKAASALLDNCSTQLISHIRNGKREVSKGIAKQIIDNYPEISLSRLLYPETDKAA